ncbi:hypothetical protein RRG08_009012 [Elysia crispata]|uniref:Uncharacterized protein n=1 Tax=Elysia crispata TaxID=231223 RepID=A0AAE0Z8J2_9GAST|nr:hypothetical protein RRG08_009012 [Elysia crispata]
MQVVTCFTRLGGKSWFEEPRKNCTTHKQRLLDWQVETVVELSARVIQEEHASIGARDFEPISVSMKASGVNIGLTISAEPPGSRVLVPLD